MEINQSSSGKMVVTLQIGSEEGMRFLSSEERFTPLASHLSRSPSNDSPTKKKDEPPKIATISDGKLNLRMETVEL